MDEGRLKELASESEHVRLKRKVLQQEIDVLRSGLRKCQRSRLHERTGESIHELPPVNDLPNASCREAYLDKQLVLPEAFVDTPSTSSRGSSSCLSP
ncbi:hypothetical protein F4859DRAFT_410728 [Xylaria cf. heliscus]|nr:hypothetical protein F4859DRAFT_410728 [Xylaria cf. heliscus]